MRAPQPTTPEVTELFAVRRGLERLAEPSAAHPIHQIPILRYLSRSWLGWRELVNQTRRLEETLYSKLYEGVIANINAGKKNGCWMETVVRRGPEIGLGRTQMA